MNMVNNHNGYVKLMNPDWARSAVIYQLNTRQFTPEGTFRAASNHLERIKNLGADIIWLMPVHKIGMKRRKGKLGSPYSVKDYYSLNPALGSLSELRSFISKAHSLGLFVILDWVANHTSWDNKLTESNPSWYLKDQERNKVPPPWTDWEDVAQLDFNNRELWGYMSNAMCWWVDRAGFDGFRADVAGFLPVKFWEYVREELEKIKPVFMLAEWESAEIHRNAFDASYAWQWWYAMRGISKGTAGIEALLKYYCWNENAFPGECMRMLFISNHDVNSWEGTMTENFGPALNAAIVLSVISNGIPLIYNGQEAGDSKRLKFYEKDCIEWKQHQTGDLYSELFSLKKKNPSLWNGKWGSEMIKTPNSCEDHVMSFIREKGNNKVFAVFNLSGSRQKVRFRGRHFEGGYMDYFGKKHTSLGKHTILKLAPWDYRVFIK